jgi:hypothetical protein
MLTFDHIVTLFVAGMLLAFASAYARGEPDDRGQRAELPDQMMGGWCFDKLKTRALAAEGEYYHTRAAHPDDNDCANRGGIAVSKDGLISYRFGPQQVCKFDKIEPVGGGAYHVSMTCKRLGTGEEEENDFEWEIVPVPPTVPSDWEGDLPFSPDSLVWRDAPEG